MKCKICQKEKTIEDTFFRFTFVNKDLEEYTEVYCPFHASELVKDANNLKDFGYIEVINWDTR